MDLIINSESGLASKVIASFLHIAQKKINRILCFLALNLASDACASDNCHGSYPVSFLYFLYKLDRILSVKILGNPVNLACQSRYSGVNILSDLVMLPFSIIANQSN
uniref:Uncharacterized protein n=1 Tax=Rhizophagus irregularis (strain DAOM 181602 / DAOM 197198 / MUCL 43194) TaxID=747089 RepID=U9US25_RHIID